MPVVYDMPPVDYFAYSQSMEDPRSRSRSISGALRVSQTRPSRRKFSIGIHGIGSDLSGAGYIEQFRRYVDGTLPLVRLATMPDGWHISMRDAIRARGHGAMSFLFNGTPFTWRYKAQPLMVWYSTLSVTAGEDYGGDYIDVNVPTPNATIAFGGEKVEQLGLVARVRGVARSDATGAARIYVDRKLYDGSVTISKREWAVAVLDSLDPVTVPAQGGFSVQFSATEAFDTDYAEGFTYEEPWRVLA